MPNNKERTRFAPSPTGYMHIGNLRTALYAYLAAKKVDGTFILRVEDTDQNRFVEGSMDVIMDTLRVCGLDWDEGPEKGGDVGPYIQSERRDIYDKWSTKLIEQGDAYRCFCDKERLDEMRTVQTASGMPTKYDRHCRSLSQEQIEEKLASGAPFVIRQSVPTEGKVTFNDEIFGDITVDCDTLDDQVLVKADGLPTYNFANVVDDYLMNITTVIRGVEYLSSAPKYNLLYQAFGWEIPKYLHVPHIMKDHSAKLSKRNGDASFNDLVEKGYLPEAVLNYIALLGWSPKSEDSVTQEIMSLSEMTNLFSMYDVSKSPAIFDILKLNYINAEYIRRMSPEEFCELATPWIKQAVKSDIDYSLMASVLHARCEVLGDIPPQLDFIDELPDYDTELFVSKKMKTNRETSLTVLKEIIPVIQSLSDFSCDGIHTAMGELVAKLEVKNGYVLWPLRIAASGKQFTPGGAIEVCALLGKEETLKRLAVAIEKLENEAE